MSEAKPRRWFRIHLSTAVLLMFVAAGLLWVNTKKRDLKDIDDSSQPEIGYGWPLNAAIANSFSVRITVLKPGRVTGKTYDPDDWVALSPDDPYFAPKFQAFNMAADALVALALLGLACFVCEYVIRHRASRTP